MFNKVTFLIAINLASVLEVRVGQMYERMHKENAFVPLCPSLHL
uniref:Uncharacterized protein n=1 Tax=Klebsiella pneumoniae TaxID=573 RepID=A0A8B0SVR6_KLEPN|nr:hypothetical protein [Klebsiella pneumoniae]